MVAPVTTETTADTAAEDLMHAVERLLLLLHEVYTPEGVVLYLDDLGDQVEARVDFAHAQRPSRR